MKAIVLLSIAALLASGCFGYPPGSAKPGDTVTIRYTATDSSGVVVAKDQTSSFVLGAGTSGLGADVERALTGLTANATAVFVSPAASRAYGGIVTQPAEFERKAIAQTYDRAQFEQAVGPAKVGLTFQAYGYNATMTKVEDTLVTFELQSKDGQHQDFPQYGLSLVYRTDGADRVKVLEPMVGTTFSIFYASQIALDLAPGSYKVMASKDGKLQFAFYPGTDRTLVDREVTFHIAILAVAPGHPPAAPSGAYGVRASPQVLGDVSAFVPKSEAAPSNAAPS